MDGRWFINKDHLNMQIATPVRCCCFAKAVTHGESIVCMIADVDAVFSIMSILCLLCFFCRARVRVTGQTSKAEAGCCCGITPFDPQSFRTFCQAASSAQGPSREVVAPVGRCQRHVCRFFNHQSEHQQRDEQWAQHAECCEPGKCSRAGNCWSRRQ